VPSVFGNVMSLVETGCWSSRYFYSGTTLLYKT